MMKKRLYGIDTKQSAARVEKQVLQAIRKPQKQRKTLVIPTVIIVSAMLLFLTFQLTSSLPNDMQLNSKFKVPTTVLDDELIIQVSPVIENDNFLNNENITPEQEFKQDYKVLLYRYRGSKVAGEKVQFELSQHWIDFFRVNFGEDVYATGSGSSQNNDSEDFFHDEYRIVFNAKNISEADLKAALDETFMYVKYENKAGDVFENTFRLGEYLDYQE